MLLIRGLGEWHVLPQVGCQVGVGLCDGSESGLGEVTQSAGGSSRRRVAILDTSHLQQLLGDRGGDDASTSWRGDETHLDTAALSGDFARHGVWLADFVTPVTTANRHNRELGQSDGTSNSGCHFLGALYSEADVSVAVTNCDESLFSINKNTSIYLQ